MTSGVDLAEQIKWWNALDALPDGADVERGLQMARECQHPDAKWLAALCPSSGAAVTPERLEELMMQQGEDARALFIAWQLGPRFSSPYLERAAEMGYAPAQGMMAAGTADEDQFGWAQRAYDGSDRRGTSLLAFCHLKGIGCVEDKEKAIALYKKAAEWGFAPAQHMYGKVAYGKHEWLRYYWRGLGATQGSNACQTFCKAVVRLLPWFERGELGRILHTVAPVIRTGMAIQGVTLTFVTVYGRTIRYDQVVQLERVVALHVAMLGRVKQAIDCWSAAGRRCGVVRDIRVKISRMAWDEVWLWNAAGESQEEECSED
jgi:hypothetical protein